jgi:hypothetical protein
MQPSRFKYIKIKPLDLQEKAIKFPDYVLKG